MNAATIDRLGTALEVAGVALLVGGLLWAFVRALHAGAAGRFLRLRQDLGRAILLGLEVLVAADIVRSVTLAPSMDGLAVLAALVAIRTFLSWSLALEIEGRWPWQRPPHPTATETAS
jgi:uncharacterized membrane protein